MRALFLFVWQYTVKHSIVLASKGFMYQMHTVYTPRWQWVWSYVQVLAKLWQYCTYSNTTGLTQLTIRNLTIGIDHWPVITLHSCQVREGIRKLGQVWSMCSHAPFVTTTINYNLMSKFVVGVAKTEWHMMKISTMLVLCSKNSVVLAHIHKVFLGTTGGIIGTLKLKPEMF